MLFGQVKTFKHKKKTISAFDAKMTLFFIYRDAGPGVDTINSACPFNCQAFTSFGKMNGCPASNE